MGRAAELAGFTWHSRTTSTHRRITDTDSLRYAPKGWLFCASIEPTTPEEWSHWQATLDADYDHVSHIYRPREFARALAGMVAEQLGAQSGTEPLTASMRGVPSQRTQHPSQLVFHGPVIYVDDVDSWLHGAKSERDLFLRTVFTKGMSHQEQREYRFLVWSDAEPEHECHLLRASPALVDSMTGSGNSLGPPRIPELQPIEDDDSARHSSLAPNPLIGSRMWLNLADKVREQAEQLGAIVQPHRLDPESPPSNLRARTATYEGVTALWNAVRLFHDRVAESVERKNAAAAAAWFAEQDIRTLCATFDGPIAGIEISDDGFIVVHIALPKWPDMECRLAVAPSGHSTIKMDEGGHGCVIIALDSFYRRDVGEQVKDFVEGYGRQDSKKTPDKRLGE